jgi:hypothetical protein
MMIRQFFMLLYGFVLVSCASLTTALPSADIDLAWDGSAVALTITNTGQRTLSLADAGYNDGERVPAGVFVRVADDSGAILANQVEEPEGWWTPRFLDSSMPEEPAPIALAPASEIHRSFNPTELVQGMRYNQSHILTSCRFQVRVTVSLSRSRRTTTSSSDWIEIPCSQLFQAGHRNSSVDP